MVILVTPVMPGKFNASLNVNHLVTHWRQAIQAMESMLLPDGSTIDDYTKVHWMSAFEYKHESAILTTILKARQIVSSVFNGIRFHVLDFSLQ
jgi:hypothetical protein